MIHHHEDVSVDIVHNLRQRGFDVLSTHEAWRLQLDDARLDFAAQEHRALVTHNRRDFEVRPERALADGKTHHGIIIARRRANAAAVVSRLLALLNTMTAEEMVNQLRSV